MAASSDAYHEPSDKLSSTTQGMHRALVSLQRKRERGCKVGRAACDLHHRHTLDDLSRPRRRSTSTLSSGPMPLGSSASDSSE